MKYLLLLGLLVSCAGFKIPNNKIQPMHANYSIEKWDKMFNMVQNCMGKSKTSLARKEKAFSVYKFQCDGELYACKVFNDYGGTLNCTRKS